MKNWLIGFAVLVGCMGCEGVSLSTQPLGELHPAGGDAGIILPSDGGIDPWEPIHCAEAPSIFADDEEKDCVRGFCETEPPCVP